MQKQTSFKNNQKDQKSGPVLRNRNLMQPTNKSYVSKFNNPQVLQVRKSNQQLSQVRNSRLTVPKPRLSASKQKKQREKRYLKRIELQELNSQKQDFDHSQRSSSISSKPIRRSTRYRKARSNQFKRHLDDSDNVFWENSWQMKKLKICLLLKICLIVVILVLLISYFGIKTISPLPKEKCPANAQCGVYIHCQEGYILLNNNCSIDPTIKVRAKSIVTAVVEQLKLEYGSKDCQHQNLDVPTKGALQIFSQFKVMDQLLKNQIYTFLQDKQNSVKHYFHYQNFLVTPTEKLHPVACQIQLSAQTATFYWLLLGFVISIAVCVKLVTYLQLKRKARLAYNYLKQRCHQNEFIFIQQHKAPIKKMVGKWNQQLWQEIDQLRGSQRQIVYYEQNGQLYWKICKHSRVNMSDM